jgi:4-amino-4-deoxy-L-arabinose transferase-like glycosyltransferase
MTEPRQEKSETFFVDNIPPNTWVSLTFFWLVLWACVMLSRPLLPIDETRCVSVAWEMWQSGNLLVPHLNGMPYSHKPPFLFWTIIAGWKCFGVNEWWPRLIPPLFGLGCLFLTALFARRLWPDKKDAAFLASHILLGSALWTLFTTVVMYDMLSVFFILVCLLCLYAVVQGNQGRSFLSLLPIGIALGLGILSKGPVILLSFISAAVFAPWWGRNNLSGGRIKFYGGVIFSLILAAGVSLSWALPAAQSGGPEYAEAILWGQTKSRMVKSFAHQQPWWWYFTVLPALLFPWTANPSFWCNIRKLDFRDPGIRFCLCWLVPTLFAFSIISGKQVYYLLPLFPAFALLSTRIMTAGQCPRRFDLLPMAFFTMALGILMIVIPSFRIGIAFPSWVYRISPIFGILAVIASMAAGLLPVRKIKTVIRSSTLLIVFLIVIIHIGVFSQARPYYDLRPIALFLKSIENKGFPVAHVNTYYGQFHFLGRLDKPFEVIDDLDQASDWFKGHPQGRIVVYFRKWPKPVSPELKVEYSRPYMGKYLVILKPS